MFYLAENLVWKKWTHRKSPQLLYSFVFLLFLYQDCLLYYPFIQQIGICHLRKMGCKEETRTWDVLAHSWIRCKRKQSANEEKSEIMVLFYSHLVVETIKMICRPQQSYRHKSANSALAIHGWAKCLEQKKKYNKFQQAENTALSSGFWISLMKRDQLAWTNLLDLPKL